MPDTGAQRQEMAGGIAEAIDETSFETDETEVNPADTEFDDEGDLTPDPELVTPPSTPESTTPEGEEPEGEPEGEPQAETPEEYWGIRLEGVSAEKRAEIIAGLEQRDSTIHKLQEQMTALRTKEAEAEAPVAEEPEEIDDATLLQAAGYDPEDYEVQQNAKFLVPQLRRQLELEEQVESLAQARQVETVEQQWNASLDQLETEFGKIPFEREDVLRYAIDQQIASPYEAYFRIAAPARKEVSDALGALRRDVQKQVVTGGVKPQNRGGGGPSPALDPKMSLKDAVKAAAKDAQKETGLKWKDAARGRRSPKE